MNDTPPLFQRASSLSYWLVAPLIAALISWAFWPATSNGFVWDDVIDFVENDWLTKGDQWKHYIFRDFNGWVNYFRPLVVGLFTLQVRLFDVQPGPMHAVSIGMHVINSLIIGLLVLQSRRTIERVGHSSPLWFSIPTLAYGLHPVLIEGVAWIGCQFDLTATFFMLSGLLFNTIVRTAILRITLVTCCFFLAACSKESAAVFPLLLFFFEWLLISRRQPAPFASTLRTLVARNAGTMVALFTAGLSYLWFRWWALGLLTYPVEGIGADLSAIGKLQQTAYAYFHYWRMLLWPSHGLGPVHIYKEQVFEQITPTSMSVVVFFLAMILGSTFLFLRRSSGIACLILAVTASLLPVMHLLPTGFDSSLYHERYAINALAMACIMLPLLATGAVERIKSSFLRWMAAILFVAWIAISIGTIRTTLPLWANDVALWQWAWRNNPTAYEARFNLMATLSKGNSSEELHKLAGNIMRSEIRCADCILLAAQYAMNQKDMRRLETYLEYVRTSEETGRDGVLYSNYMTTVGYMLLLKEEWKDAASALKEATVHMPDEIMPYVLLAVAMNNAGNYPEARTYAEKALALTRADYRAALHENLVRRIGKGKIPVPSNR